MFKLTSTRQSKPNGNAGTYQPLPEHDDQHAEVVFSVEDDEDAEGIAELDESPAHEQRSRSVRFEEDVRVIGPPLRSTIASREAGAQTTQMRKDVLTDTL